MAVAAARAMEADALEWASGSAGLGGPINAEPAGPPPGTLRTGVWHSGLGLFGSGSGQHYTHPSILHASGQRRHGCCCRGRAGLRGAAWQAWAVCRCTAALVFTHVREVAGSDVGWSCGRTGLPRGAFLFFLLAPGQMLFVNRVFQRDRMTTSRLAMCIDCGCVGGCRTFGRNGSAFYTWNSP